MEQNIAAQGIAHTHIKERRIRKEVRSKDGGRPGLGGVVADYVPFYFAPRCPMLYAIHMGNVQGYAEGQNPIVHLVANAEEVAARQDFVFTDGHAVMALSDFYGDLGELDKVDWNIMKERYWRDTSEDGDRSRRRQAEFLVHGFLPWTFVRTIGVMDQLSADKVAALLEVAEHRPTVSIQRDWYY